MPAMAKPTSSKPLTKPAQADLFGAPAPAAEKSESAPRKRAAAKGERKPKKRAKANNAPTLPLQPEPRPQAQQTQPEPVEEPPAKAPEKPRPIAKPAAEPSPRRQPQPRAQRAGDDYDVDRDPLIVGLNPEQKRAVLHDKGPLLVLAGAGSGKTRVITHRIAYLVRRRRVRPYRIMAVTFSNKAAGEMRHRIEELLGEGSGDLWLGTFHSTGARLMRSIAEHGGIGRSFSIYDRDDQLKMLSRVMKALGISDKQYKPRAVSSYIDRAKNACQLPSDPELPRDGPQNRKFAEIYERYEKEMRLADAVDFGDLLMRPVTIFDEQPALAQHWAKRFDHILVDEFQDTNEAQYRLLEHLAKAHGNLCVVGDDDQSIYAWRGARIANIIGFPDRQQGANVVKLERNYRSTQIILSASGAIVARNPGRHDKTLWTDVKDGAKVHLAECNSDRDEADWIARRVEQLRSDVKLSQIAVFYRTNAQSRVLEESMGRYRLPAVVVGGLRFYERAEVKDLLAYCRLVVNPKDSASWLRAINTPRRGIGKRTVDVVDERARAHGVSLPEACASLVASDPSSRVGRALSQFEDLMARIRKHVDGLSADRAGADILQMSGLKKALQDEGTLESETRLDNLGELLSAMGDYADESPDPSLTGFLEQTALVADTDKLKPGSEAVSLMTMHSAKGLEYDVTFVAGLEDGLVPHVNSFGEGGVEEERRLLYVAMTRARKRLHLSWARTRRRFGVDEYNLRSPFVNDIPPEVLDAPGGQTLGSSGGFARIRPERSYSWGGGQRRSGGWGGGGGQRRSSSSVARLHDRHARKRAVEKAAANEAERVIQRDSDGDLAAGSFVIHGSFGRGQVVDVSGYGTQARVTVRFASVGTKKVIARFLKPSK